MLELKMLSMEAMYFSLAGLHMLAIVVTGILWTLVDIRPASRLKPHLQDIRAVHFGSLYLVPWFLGLTYAFQRLRVPWLHQAAFPAGLALLIFFAGIAYLLPRSKDVAPFYYWTRGWPMFLSMIGLVGLIAGILWTAGILCFYAIAALKAGAV
jgi:hypothetical protein